MSTPFENRLRKRYRHLRKFAKRWPTNAFRLYDRDIPEYAWTVDQYADRIYLQNIKNRGGESQLEEVMDAIVEVTGVEREAIAINERRKRGKNEQYERAEEMGQAFKVFEGDYEFWVNLDRYIDSGLFLDHRNMRRMVGEQVERMVGSMDRAPRVLNLFAYTGAFSVWAAGAGARVTTVDMSNTYLDWAERNFSLNSIAKGKHTFERADIMRWLPRLKPQDTWDIIVLDPPTFSKSKKMESTLDVQRDHVLLINMSMRHLNRGGTLYFSTNLRTFKIDEDRIDAKHIEEITPSTMSEDFRSGIHRAWKIR